MIAWIEARVWQIGAIGGGVVAVGLAVALGVTTFQKVGLERDVARLETRVETVLSDLKTCRGNTLTLVGAIDARNAQIERLGAESAARLSVAEKAVADARAATAATQSRLNRLLNAPASGTTVCERLDEVDRAVLESFQ